MIEGEEAVSELANWAIQIIHEEGGASLYLRGIAEPFKATELSKFDNDSEGLLKAKDGRISVVFDGADLVAVKTIRPATRTTARSSNF